MEQKRLSKLLAGAGVASRRACEEIIFSGRVKVNNQIVKIPQTLVSFESDEIRVDGKLVRREESKVCYLLNKPKGYICTSDPIPRSILNLFNKQERLFTVGRLDKDTTGLILVTNDGNFANEVIHPRSNIEKEYLVKTDKEISDEHLKALSKGGFVEGSFVKPVRVQKVRRGTLKIVVKEGKKREVRILVKKAGLEVISLSRIRIGALKLGNLGMGSYKVLSERERELIFS